jgi:FAD/FMN-containing dehydrogenase/ubiquinone/menaquinone biosynthesis C-methylase UbiE
MKIRLFNIVFKIVLLVCLDISIHAQNIIINDVTQLNPISVEKVITPTSLEEIRVAVQNHQGPISIGGGRYSMGGQTATEQALQIDMRQFNKILAFSKEQKEITVQPGITWRMIQDYIDPHDLSIQIMQTYSNFTVGGSLSVNVHGRYIGKGPLIYSVKSIKLVLANGQLVQASPFENQHLFYGAIGGYGALGVIVEATLNLDDNVKLERLSKVMFIHEYKNYFLNEIREKPEVIFHNADIYPENYEKVRAISYVKTNKEVTVEDRIRSTDRSYWLEHLVMWIVSEAPFGKWFREYIVDPIMNWGDRIVWRNHEASYNVMELEPASRINSTYVLQEYFVPVEQFDEFIPIMAEIFNRHEVNIINVSIRHAKKDPGSLLAWAKSEVFAFVIYYKQETSAAEKNKVAVWTREMIDAVNSLNGAYYLPYQIHANAEQFHKAYPMSDSFFVLKKMVDPENKFRNKLWDTYYQTNNNSIDKKFITSSRFKNIMSQQTQSDGMYLFLQNIYGLYPPDQFHQLIKDATDKFQTDKEIYDSIQKALPEVTPSLWAFRYALPALKIQKKEIARQTAQLLGKNYSANGYLEIGTTGRYVNSLKDHIQINGEVYLSNDDVPNYSLQEIMERGQLRKQGTFFNFNDYAPISPSQIPNESLDLVTIYIGLHHCPSAKLDAYINSVWRILRPGGKLIIRDHDIKTKEFGEFVSLIHDVFYSGLEKSWDFTSTEIRNFISSDSLSNYLSLHGFKESGERHLQAHDPSLNTLMVFTKTVHPQIEINIQSELNKTPNYSRDEAQTYLTLPEWFLVYSPGEYADWLKDKRPSEFPYFRSSKQFWSYYNSIYQVTNNKYGFNWGYHLMVFVIGTSYTVENVLKGIYENTIGRFTEWTRGNTMTEEDQYAAQVAQEYVDFIHVDPWYDFPFWNRFKKLWCIDLFGSNLIRKTERKLFLSIEYGGKAAYAWLIRLGTKSVYGDADNYILARVNKIPEKTKSESGIKVIKQFQDSSALIVLPRYEKFKSAVSTLSFSNIYFLEIAGNDEILMTCIFPKNKKNSLTYTQTLFEKPILTSPDYKRIAINVPVKKLHQAILSFHRENQEIEHIYDY